MSMRACVFAMLRDEVGGASADSIMAKLDRAGLTITDAALPPSGAEPFGWWDDQTQQFYKVKVPLLRSPEVWPLYRTAPPRPVGPVKTLDQWHEDFGPVVWFCWDSDNKRWLGEPAWIGTPNDDSWPDYHTHWIPHPPMPMPLPPSPPDSPGATEES